MSDQYKFTFDATNTSILKMFEVERNKIKLQKTTGSTFEAETGINDQNVEGVVAVTQTKLSKGYVETSIFSDQDGNGLFQEAFEIDVATSSVLNSKLEKHQFTFDESGNVTLDLELSKGKWKVDRIDLDEDFAQVTLDGVNYVVKTEQERNGVEFELFRDDNQDGIWTKIAEGEASSEYLDPVNGSIDLVGIQNYLDASIGIIG